MMKNRMMSMLLTLVLALTLIGCGDAATQTAVTGEGTKESTTAVDETANESNEATKETDDTDHVELEQLSCEDSTKVTTNGTLYIGTDYEGTENPVINVDWEITNIAVSDSKDGIQTVIIEQESHGYIWVDDTGNIFATNLNIPVGRLCDIHTGKMIPVGRETATDTEIEWKGKNYTISAIETAEWVDGDWSTDWEEDPNGGERLSSTLKVRLELTITEGYDGLALVLVPITDENGSVDGGMIMDVWADGSYLFNIGKLSAKFEHTGEAVAEETSMSAETQASAESNQKPAEETTRPVEETIKPAESTLKPTEAPAAHSHNYNGVVTRQATCTVAGEKTYTCSCGDFYTENLGTVAHDYSVPVTQTVHHDEQYEAVKREIPAYAVIRCGCGAEFTSNDEWQNHVIENVQEEGIFSPCTGNYNVTNYPAQTVYDYVKVADAYDSEEIVGYKCSVCGQQK